MPLIVISQGKDPVKSSTKYSDLADKNCAKVFFP